VRQVNAVLWLSSACARLRRWMFERRRKTWMTTRTKRRQGRLVVVIIILVVIVNDDNDATSRLDALLLASEHRSRHTEHPNAIKYLKHQTAGDVKRVHRFRRRQSARIHLIRIHEVRIHHR